MFVAKQTKVMRINIEGELHGVLSKDIILYIIQK